MGVGLVAAPGANSRTRADSFGGTSTHRLTRGDELLGQQRTGPGRAFDRPRARLEPGREAQQPIALVAISTHPDLVDELLVDDRAPPRCATPCVDQRR